MLFIASTLTEYSEFGCKLVTVKVLAELSVISAKPLRLCSALQGPEYIQVMLKTSMLSEKSCIQIIEAVVSITLAVERTGSLGRTGRKYR